MASPRSHNPLELLDRRWAPQILIRLLDGPQRFAQLAVDIPGVSRRMLTERLRELTAAGIIHRQAGTAGSVTYALSDNRQLRAALRSLRTWAETTTTPLRTAKTVLQDR
jgi:DNA-binding HxlR family transcriptional regulator